MPTHVTESTGASISAEWDFTTGTLEIGQNAYFKMTEPTTGTEVYLYPQWNGVHYELVISTTAP